MLTTIGTGVLAAAVVVSAVLGTVAIRTQWMPPWLRCGTPRPVLWGYATLAGSAGVCLWCVGLTAGHAHVFGFAGLILIIANTVLSYLATRPGHVTSPVTPPPS